MGLLATEAARSVGLNCYLCGTAFWIERELYVQRKNDRRTFWCPNGHDQHFVGETAEQVRIKELERQVATERANAESHRRQRQWAETRAKGANIQAGKAKAALRRTVERVHAGVCPHCNRTFKQLAAHMQAKHKSEVGR